MVGHHFATFDGHWSYASGDIKNLTCHVTSKSFVVERTCNFMSGSSSLHIKLPILVAIGLVKVDI